MSIDTDTPTVPPPRQPVFNLPTSILVFAGLCIVIHGVRVWLLDDAMTRLVLLNFAFFPIRYDLQFLAFDLPTLVSPLSYSFLHGDWIHLGINMVWLAAFGSPLAWRIGWWRTALLWGATAIGAAALHLALYWGDSVPLIGASGAVSGFMGAAARFGFRANRSGRRRGFAGPRMGVVTALRAPGVLGFLLVWMVINYLAGAGFLGISGDQSIAWEAHIGGLLAGYLLVGFIDRPSAQGAPQSSSN